MRTNSGASSEYIAKLNEVKTEGVAPLAHVGGLADVFREDAPRASLPREDILVNAPGTDGEFFLVPKVIESHES